MSGLVRTYLGGTCLGRYFPVSAHEVLKLAGKADRSAITIRELNRLIDRPITSMKVLSNLIYNVLDPVIAAKQNDPKGALVAAKLKAFLETVADFRFQKFLTKLEARTIAGQTNIQDLEELGSFLAHFPHFGVKPRLEANIFKPIRDDKTLFGEGPRKLAQELSDQCLAYRYRSHERPLLAAAVPRQNNEGALYDPNLAAKYPRLFRMIKVNSLEGNREPEKAFTEKRYDVLWELINERRKFLEAECRKGHLPPEEYEKINQHLLGILEELSSYLGSGA